ncbi:MAG TPA: hypothetical protein VHO69_19225 [Phototrophicaceae bacterium]|nr:hypothetical protein [Phototrophicaceae bacterium]
MIDLNNFYSGGYFLLRANKPDWPQLKTDLLPEKIISLSLCICPRLEIYWGWIPGNPEAALEFGIPQEKLDEFLLWCKAEYQTDLELTSMFYSTAAARRFIQRFLPDTTNLYLIGAGLPKELEVKDWREFGEGEIIGIEKRIEKYLPLENSGDILGFEVISFEYQDLAHSWLCGSLHQTMCELFGFHPNKFLVEGKYKAKD